MLKHLIFFLTITLNLVCNVTNSHGYIEVEDAEIFYTAYTKESKTQRPITFCFNGGPGSSSVWLHMGAFGPKRFDLSNISPPYQWVDNEETILQLTDLVFVDPVGTGLSTAEDESPYFEVNKDIESLSAFIESYIAKHNRFLVPKFIAGESYGAFRAVGIAEKLHRRGLYLNGLILISPALDFNLLGFMEDTNLPYALSLPTIAATNWHFHGQKGSFDDVITRAKEFSYNEYLPLLNKGSLYSHPDEREKIAEKLESFTSCPKQRLLSKNLKIEFGDFIFNFLDHEKKFLGLHDTRYTAHKVDEFWRFDLNPSFYSIDGLFTAGFKAYLSDMFQIDNAKDYVILSESAHRAWDYSMFKENAPTMRRPLTDTMTLNAQLKIYVASGYFDLVTPFAATEYFFSQIDPYFLSRVTLKNFAGGHMFYLDDDSRKEMHKSLTEFFQK